MRRTVLSIAFSCLATAAMAADVRPESLSAFDLGRSHALRGFVLARPKQNTFSARERSSRAPATIDRQFFHGGTEIRYSILRFATVSEAERWVVAMQQGCMTLFIARRATPDGRYERMSPPRPPRPGTTVLPAARAARPVLTRWRGESAANARPPMAVVARCTAIRLGAYQHPEMKRRDPAAFARSLSDEELRRRAVALVREMTRIAMTQ